MNSDNRIPNVDVNIAPVIEIEAVCQTCNTATQTTP